jgi:hypothetical protein
MGTLDAYIQGDEPKLWLFNPSSGLGPSEVQQNFALDTANSEESCSRRSTGDEEDVVDEAKDAEIQWDESRARVI